MCRAQGVITYLSIYLSISESSETCESTFIFNFISKIQWVTKPKIPTGTFFFFHVGGRGRGLEWANNRDETQSLFPEKSYLPISAAFLLPDKSNTCCPFPGRQNHMQPGRHTRGSSSLLFSYYFIVLILQTVYLCSSVYYPIQKKKKNSL